VHGACRTSFGCDVHKGKRRNGRRSSARCCGLNAWGDEISLSTRAWICSKHVPIEYSECFQPFKKLKAGPSVIVRGLDGNAHRIATSSPLVERTRRRNHDKNEQALNSEAKMLAEMQQARKVKVEEIAKAEVDLKQRRVDLQILLDQQMKMLPNVGVEEKYRQIAHKRNTRIDLDELAAEDLKDSFMRVRHWTGFLTLDGLDEYAQVVKSCMEEHGKAWKHSEPIYSSVSVEYKTFISSKTINYSNWYSTSY